jgi:hypothetical protein
MVAIFAFVNNITGRLEPFQSNYNFRHASRKQIRLMTCARNGLRSPDADAALNPLPFSQSRNLQTEAEFVLLRTVMKLYTLALMRPCEGMCPFQLSFQLAGSAHFKSDIWFVREAPVRQMRQQNV